MRAPVRVGRPEAQSCAAPLRTRPLLQAIGSGRTTRGPIEAGAGGATLVARIPQVLERKLVIVSGFGMRVARRGIISSGDFIAARAHTVTGGPKVPRKLGRAYRAYRVLTCRSFE